MAVSVSVIDELTVVPNGLGGVAVFLEVLAGVGDSLAREGRFVIVVAFRFVDSVVSKHPMHNSNSRPHTTTRFSFVIFMSRETTIFSDN